MLLAEAGEQASQNMAIPTMARTFRDMNEYYRVPSIFQLMCGFRTALRDSKIFRYGLVIVGEFRHEAFVT